MKKENDKQKDTVAILTDENQMLKDQIAFLEDQVEDLTVQLDDCEKGTNNAGFIDPVDDDKDDVDDMSLRELCNKQQEDLDSLLSDCNDAVDLRDRLIDALKETAKHRDSIIKSLRETIRDQNKTIEALKKMMSEILPIMQSRIDKREVLLKVHRDGRTLADAVREFAAASGRPVSDIEKILKNEDI